VTDAHTLRRDLMMALVGAMLGILATGTGSLIFVGSQLHALDLKVDAVNLNLSTRLTAVETRLAAKIP
jgi:hypothetical protein